MRTWPGAAGKPPAATTIPSAPAESAERVDGVRVDGRVGADDDARRRSSRSCCRRRRACRPGATAPVATMPPSLAREHLVARDAARVEVRRAAAEVDAAVEADDDVVLDAQAGGEEADLVAAAPASMPVRPTRTLRRSASEQPDAGELDRRAAARSPRRVREDDEVLERRADDAADADRGRRGGAADDREVLDGDGDRLRDRERRAARDEDRRRAPARGCAASARR